MLDRAIAADISADGDVIWRIDKHHSSALRTHQYRIGIFFNGVSAEDAMFPELPQIAWLGHRIRVVLDFEGVIRIRLGVSVSEQQIDLRNLKTGDGYIELGLDIQKVLK